MGTDSALSYYFYNYDVDKNESIVISTIFFGNYSGVHFVLHYLFH